MLNEHGDEICHNEKNNKSLNTLTFIDSFQNEADIDSKKVI